MKHSSSLKRFSALCLAVLLLSLLAVPALADAWVPPDDDYAVYLDMPEGRRVVSLFISNYIETGLTAYNGGNASSAVYACVLKDMELNYSQFKDGLTISTDSAGQQYMRIAADKFEQRAITLFPKSALRASGCVGYSGGAITVTADHAGGPIELVATTDSVEYHGNYEYEAFFTVWRVNTGSTSAIYGSTYDVPESKVTKLTTGQCYFTYSGDSDAQEISTWELELINYQINGELGYSSAILDANRAYTPVNGGNQGGQTPPPAVSSDQTEAATEAVETADETTLEAMEEGDVSIARNGTDSDLSSGRKQSSNKTVIYAIAVLAVVIIVLLVVLIIVVVLKKR